MVLPCRVAHSAVVALASLTPLSSRWLTNSPAGITTTAAAAAQVNLPVGHQQEKETQKRDFLSCSIFIVSCHLTFILEFHFKTFLSYLPEIYTDDPKMFGKLDM